MAVAAVAGQVDERLRHEGRAQAVLLGDRLGHEFEEDVPIRREQHVVVVPVHL
jgi:adenylylsulfate kinase-like enzyme